MRIFLIVALLLTGISMLQAEQDSIPIPDYRDKVYQLDRDNKLQPLELARTETVTKGGGVSYIVSVGTGKTNIVINGLRSSNKVLSDSKFVIRLDDPLVDPEQWVYLYRLKMKPNKRYRYLPISKNTGVSVGVFGNNKSESMMDESMVRLSFERIAEGVYVITPNRLFVGGEYFFTVIDPDKEISTSAMVNAFGVK